MTNQEFDAFVATASAALDVEGSGDRTMQATAEGTIGSRFTETMKQLWASLGNIPWTKVFAVAAAVVEGLRAGKSIAEIVMDVVAAWNKGAI